MNKKFQTPHGGEIINLLVDDERAAQLKEVALSLADITLNERQLCDLEMLSVGAFTPLSGFMCRSDYESVLDRMLLQDKTVWPIPVCLDISETKANSFEAGQSIALRDPEGFLLAILHIDDIWPIEKEKEAQNIYGTMDQHHQGVYQLFHATADYYVGGRIDVLNLPIHSDYNQLRKTPAEMHQFFDKLNWQRVVCFQTRNPIHRPQFEMTIRAMRQAKANILIHPVVGMT
ncbi:MAG: adenylyltransferase, partial [Deltaproteobacteria bacterium]|nr:adenylyltransferase [Deltaproteobacteria bacterium]